MTVCGGILVAYRCDCGPGFDPVMDIAQLVGFSAKGSCELNSSKANMRVPYVRVAKL